MTETLRAYVAWLARWGVWAYGAAAEVWMCVDDFLSFTVTYAAGALGRGDGW